jgi:hypothetical protein
METSSQLEDFSTVAMEETDSSSSLVQEQEVLQSIESVRHRYAPTRMKPSEKGELLKEVYLRRYRSRQTKSTIKILFFYALFKPLIWLSDRKWKVIG